ncbi:MAG: hypothetical protein FJX30_00395 [Alphaproteobacteria bacterium]|nr:hypothetical protein [Alphaproteobacteria bacterium]
MDENQHNKDLNYYRNLIDQIDMKILELLKDRMKIVQNVAQLKKSNNEKFFIRSGREADMIKNLVKINENHLPKSMIINIWRKIITTANISEQTIKIAIHNPKNISDYTHLVKNYYNDEVPILNFDSANSIASELENNNCQIGIFALPTNNDDNDKKEDTKENWWISLANNRSNIKIFAKIPFAEHHDNDKNINKINLVAVAIKETEQSCDDNTLLSIETNREISKLSVINTLKECGFEAKILKSVQVSQFEGIRFHLAEINNFINENSLNLKKLSQSKIKPFVKILGYYAKPIII